MKYVKKVQSFCVALILVLCMVLAWAGNVYALSVRIAFSDPSVMEGNEVTVNMKVSSLDASILGDVSIMLAYDASLLEFISGTNAQGGAGSISIKGGIAEGQTSYEYALKFKALAAGTASITVTTWEIYDSDDKMASLDRQGSASVTITAAASSSNDADLTSLRISPGELSPAFSADVTDYSASVGTDITRVVVNAATSNANAKVVISGNDDLVEGDNTITAKVTAEDGTTVKVYTITVNKTDTGSVETSTTAATTEAINIGGIEYTVAETFDASLLPEGFEMTTYTYGGKEVAAGKLTNSSLLIMYLIGNDGSGDFFAYSESAGTFSPYVQITVSARSITILPLDEGVEIPIGFSETVLELNGKRVTGWLWGSDTEQRYCVVYGMNSSGEKGFYRYDMTEKTIQRYFEDPNVDTGVSSEEYAEVANNYNTLLDDYKIRGYIVVGLAILAVVLFILVIFLLIWKNRRTPMDRVATPRRGREYVDRGNIVKNIEAKVSKKEQYLMDKAEYIEEEDDFEELSSVNPNVLTFVEKEKLEEFGNTMKEEVDLQEVEESVSDEDIDDFEEIEL